MTSEQVYFVLWLSLALVALAASAFYAGCETGLYCLNRVRLRLRMGRQEAPALLLGRCIEDQQGFVTQMLIGTNVSNFALTAVVTLFLIHSLQLSDSAAEFYTTLVLTPIVFVFGEVVPKAWFQREADVLLYRCGPLLRGSEVVIRSTGLVWLLSHLTGFMIRRFSPSERTAQERLASPRSRAVDLLREGMLPHVVHPEHTAMVDRVLNLSATPVHMAMIPRNSIVGIPAGMDRSGLLGAVRRSPHSRLPIFRESVNRIVGVLHVHDALADTSWQHVEEKADRPLWLDPHQTVASAIVALQQAGQSMAIVRDRSGRTVGLVTLKDLLEEIVGDLPAW